MPYQKAMCILNPDPGSPAMKVWGSEENTSGRHFWEESPKKSPNQHYLI